MLKKVLSLGILLCLSLNVFAEPTVIIDPASARLAEGGELVVELKLVDFPVTEGGGVTLSFNPDVLNVTAVQVDESTWSLSTLKGVVDNQAGTLTNLVFARFPGISGDLPVATIIFQAVGKGKSELVLSGSELNPFASAGDKVEVVFKSAKIAVKPRASNKNANRK